MVLKPLEFSDCISDSPWFRQNLHEHEAALEDAYKNIKVIEQQCRDLIHCNKKLSQAQAAFAKSLTNFRLETVGLNQTDDERQIATCLGGFGRVLLHIEEHREKMIAQAEISYLEPMRKFRVDVIGKTLHEDKKKYEKESAKFYSSLDKHLHLSTIRKSDEDFREADAQLEMQQHNFCQASLQYVEEVQNVQERMKFEFVETMANFLYSWLSFFYVGYVVHEDFKPFLDNIKVHIQKASDSFKTTQSEAEELKKKILKTHTKVGSIENGEGNNGNSSGLPIKQGYMYVQEKSKIPKTLSRDVLKGTWSKYYCVYSKETTIFTMIAVNAPTKTDMRSAVGQSTSYKLKECVKKHCDSIDKRFCLDMIVDNKSEPITLQALSEEDRRQWIEAMDGAKKSVYSSSGRGPSDSVQTQLDDIGFEFVRKCIGYIEEEGIREQGIYRNCGVNSKVKKMMTIGLERRKGTNDKSWIDETEWETKTVSSALKTYLRNLPEPLMTFDLHSFFISAAKMDDRSQRVEHIHFYVYKLPRVHMEMLELIIRHLRRVSDESGENLMTVGNLGVCFGPTLLRPREETVAAIMDIKFCNVVVEVLIAHSSQIFDNRPPLSIGPPKPEHLISRRAIDDKEIIEDEEENERRQDIDNIEKNEKMISKGDDIEIRINKDEDIIYEKGSSHPLQSSHSFDNDRRHIKRSAHVDADRPRTRTYPSSSSSSNEMIQVSSRRKDIQEGINRCESKDKKKDKGIEGIRKGGGTISNSLESFNLSYNPTNLSTPYIPPCNPHPSTSVDPISPSLSSSSSTSSPLIIRPSDPSSIPSCISTQSSIRPPLPPLRSSSSINHNRYNHSKLDDLPSIDTSLSPSTHHHIISSISPMYAFVNPISSSSPCVRVRTLYTCTPDHDSELSFEAGQIITNVYESKEDGWLVGTLNGKTGLIPANYVEHL